jgi:hypothetical protein
MRENANWLSENSRFRDDGRAYVDTLFERIWIKMGLICTENVARADGKGQPQGQEPVRERSGF